MSSSEACRTAKHKPYWWVNQYRQNTSAFNGYRPTPSDYSEVQCAAPEHLGHCGNQDSFGATRGRVWRTKAKYVEELPLRKSAGVDGRLVPVVDGNGQAIGHPVFVPGGASDGPATLVLRLEDPVERILPTDEIFQLKTPGMDKSIQEFEAARRTAAVAAAVTVDEKVASYRGRGFTELEEFEGFRVGTRVRGFLEMGASARYGTAEVAAILGRPAGPRNYVTFIVITDDDCRVKVWTANETVLAKPRPDSGPALALDSVPQVSELDKRRATLIDGGFNTVDEYRGFTVGARARRYNEVGDAARLGSATVEAVLVLRGNTRDIGVLLVRLDGDQSRLAVWQAAETTVVYAPSSTDESITRGLEQSAAGETVDLGSFAGYLEEDGLARAH